MNRIRSAVTINMSLYEQYNNTDDNFPMHQKASGKASKHPIGEDEDQIQ